MKKISLLLMLGLLIIGAQAYAAGDLIVNGKLGIGTDSSSEYALDLYKKDNYGNNSYGIRGTVESTKLNAYATGGEFNVQATGSFNTNPLAGLRGNIYHYGSGNFTNDAGLSGGVVFSSLTPGSSSGNAAGLKGRITFLYENQRNFVFSDLVAVETQIVNNGGTGSITGTNLTGLRIKSPVNLNGFTNVIGLHLGKQGTGLSSSIGIWLEGDGAGADIVFGPSKEARIYSSSGRLYAQDSFGNQTILSPHDPETGEWIYYSKNIKTGKTVRVDMEKLVKAVEKLTGEKFMVESLIEEK
jgi:hypothetical protein